MGKLRILSLLALVGAMIVPATSSAEELPRQIKPYVFMHLVAERGLECDLLVPWQSAVLKAQPLQPARKWDADTKAALAEAVEARVAATPCDDEGMTQWIDAAARGFESEYLPPFIIMYRALAQMENPPGVFTAATLRSHFGPEIAAIDAKLADLESSGTVADGGMSWPDTIARTEKAAAMFAKALGAEPKNMMPDAPDSSETTRPLSPDQAAAYIAQAALITELWLKQPVRNSE